MAYNLPYVFFFFNLCGHYWPIVPAPDDTWGWLWRNWWNEDWQGKPNCASPGWYVRVIVEKLVEWRLAGDTEVLGGNLPQRHFVHHKFYMTRPRFEPGSLWWKPATNRLSYGAAPGVIKFLWLPKLQQCDDKVHVLLCCFSEALLHWTNYSLLFTTSLLIKAQFEAKDETVDKQIF
jgi:hypothetical protein